MARAAAAALLALPALALVWRAAFGDLGANPVETVTHETGSWAIRLLLATLAVTPLRQWTGQRRLGPWRRRLGLAAFAYASLHVATWLALDHAFDWAAMLEDVAERPYVTAGAAAFVCLVPLAATSTRRAVRRLGRRWVMLHRLVYVAAAAAVVHHLWLVKADLRTPLIEAGVLALLLGARVAHRWRRAP